MGDPDAQPPKIAAAERGDGVTQTIVSGMTPALFEASNTGG